jgi:hypothetical protein
MTDLPDKKPDGGAAFPVDSNSDTPGFTNTGMSLRDYFAAAALPALLSAELGSDARTVEKALARAAYRLADAMIAERWPSRKIDDEDDLHK